MPAVPLAAVLYRDYEIEGDGEPPTANDLVAVFREEFGYNDRASVVADEFEALYHDDSDDWSNTQLFED